MISSKEDENSVYETYDIYKIPYVEDLNVLVPLLRESEKQVYL